MLVRKLNMTLVASGMLEAGAKVQYLHTIVRRESLRHFDSLSADVESTEPLTVEYIIKGLELYPPPVKFLLKNSTQCTTEQGNIVVSK